MNKHYSEKTLEELGNEAQTAVRERNEKAIPDIFRQMNQVAAEKREQQQERQDGV